MNIEYRLTRLERSATRWRAAAVVTGASLAGTVALGLARQDTPRDIEAGTIRADRIEIRSFADQDAHAIVIQSQDNGTATIDVYGSDGEILTQYGTNFEGQAAALSFFSSEGNLLAQSGFAPDDHGLKGMHSVFHESGEIAGTLVGGPDGGVVFALRALGGAQHAVLRASEANGSGLMLYQGNLPAATLMIDEHNRGALSLRDSDNVELIGAGADPDGAASIYAGCPITVYDDSGREHVVFFTAAPQDHAEP